VKLLRTLAALVLLVALGAYVYFWEIPRGDAKAAKDAEAKKVLRVDWDQVTDLRIQRFKQIVHLRKEGAAWKLVEPVADLADGYAVDSIVTELKDLTSERALGDVGDKLADFRLEPPDVAVSITAAGQTRTLLIGAENRVGETQFARVEGSQEVLLVPKGIYLAVTKDVQSLRNKQVFLGFDRAKLSGIDVEKDGAPLFSLVKDGEAWKLARPVAADADADEVERLVGALLYLNVDLFYQEDAQALAPFGLDPPALTVTPREKEKAWPALRIGRATDAGDGFYARRDDKAVVWVVGKDVPERIAPAVFALREKRLFTAAKDDIARVVLNYSASSVILERSGGKWVCPQSGGKEADAFKADDVLRALLDLKAQSFVEDADPARAGLDRPRLTARLLKGKGEVLAELAIGTPADGVAYARRLPAGPIVAVDRKAIDGLPARDADLLLPGTGANPAGAAPNATSTPTPAANPPSGAQGGN
jgi:hypothetical protein